MKLSHPLLRLCLLLPLLFACAQSPQNELERVKQEGVLRVLTRNAATTYYIGPQGPTGPEYDLARGFADELGVELEMVVTDNVSQVLAQLAEGQADFAAAGLTITPPRQLWARFTPAYQQITQQLVYRSGTAKPAHPGDLDGILEITAQSSHEERLQQLQREYPKLEWLVNREVESETLLSMVWDKLIEYTVSDSNEVAMNQRYFPELRIAFDISEPQGLAWAFPRFKDESLYQAASEYFQRIEQSGELPRLLERYYGHLQDFDYVGTRTYLRHIRTRLPEYRQLFEYAAEEYGLDWRLLAATAYQESHWNPDAVSPTGVRGIMMLTRTTAGELGVEKRTDPVQSIRGGALYLSKLLARVPERIQEPDRLWLALAAYNIGYGHMEDARILTQRHGRDPDSWKEVKEYLPLLRQRKWYENTRYGYARGNEAQRYVENIRSYYDILVWFIEQQTPPPPAQPRALEIENPAL